MDIACGLRHSAVVAEDGSVFTAGIGRKGQLGFLINGECPKLVDKFQKGMIERGV